MGVIMTRRKAAALNSIERDRGLLTDRAAEERYQEATPDEKPYSAKEREAVDRIRQRIGK